MHGCHFPTFTKSNGLRHLQDGPGGRRLPCANRLSDERHKPHSLGPACVSSAKVPSFDISVGCGCREAGLGCLRKGVLPLRGRDGQVGCYPTKASRRALCRSVLSPPAEHTPA